MVTLIGTGNVAWHLAEILSFNNLLDAVVGRNDFSLNQFKEKFNCEIITSKDLKNYKSTIYIICVSDNAIIDILRSSSFPVNSIIVHTSGSTPILPDYNCGVFYPLQSFSKYADLDWNSVPLLLEVVNEKDTTALLLLASKINSKTYFINTEQRKTIHIAAVFGNNFVNSIYTFVEQILATKNIPFEIVLPLLESTLPKVKNLGAKNSQTGPAIRKDTKTIINQINYLENNHPELVNLYKEISKLIQS